MKSISIIIPIYNAQEYIGRCLDSILSQTYTNFDVICVNDGSVDQSGEICRQYSRKDERIKVYDISNSGVGYARNYGLSKVEGEWFAFVDADDWIEPDFLAVLYDNAVKTGCEISACCFERNDSYCLQGEAVKDNELHILDSSKECIHAYICPDNSLYGMVWNKLYKAEIFKDILFDINVKVNEDCLYTQKIMERCQRACRTNAALYHWFYREDSACHSVNIAPDFAAADVFIHLLHRNKALNDGELERHLKKNYVLNVIHVLAYAESDRHSKQVSKAIETCKKEIDTIWSVLSHAQRIKYGLVIYFPWLIKILIKLKGRGKVFV